MKELTKPQTKALAALALLGADQYHSRLKAATAARGQWGPGYPVKTMRRLQQLGYAEPECEFVVQLVESERCRCGCDAWKITRVGIEYLKTVRVVSFSDCDLAYTHAK